MHEHIDSTRVGTTTWTNPTSHPVRFRIRSGPKVVLKGTNGRPSRVLDPGFALARRTESGGFDEWIVIGPGESVELPSEYDDVIQRLDPATGRVVSGRAPQLLKNGRKQDVHPSLDPDVARRKEIEEQGARALVARRAADEALLIAEGKRLQREQAEAPKPKAKDKDK